MSPGQDGLHAVPPPPGREGTPTPHQHPLGAMFNPLVIHLVKSDTLFIDIIIVFENAFTCKSIKHIFYSLAILNICNWFWYNM